jgi:hypothetical protein
MSTFLDGVVQRGAGIPSPVTIRPSTTSRDLPLAISSPAAPEAREELPGASSAGHESIREPSPSMPYPSRLHRAEPAAALPQRVSLTNGLEPMPGSHHASRVAARGDTAPDRVGESRSRPPRIDPIDAVPPANPRRDEPAEPAAAAPAAIVPAPRTSAMPEPPVSSKNLEQRLEPSVPGRPPIGMSSPTRAQAAAESRNIQVKIGKVEIRSTPPALPRPSTRPAPRGGFADFSMVRAYLDRAQR